MSDLLSTIAGSSFITSIENVGGDEVVLKYSLDTRDTSCSFISFDICKYLKSRRGNEKTNETVIKFSVREYRKNRDTIRPWLLFIRYLESTFHFTVSLNYFLHGNLHIELIVVSNRTCIDDILRAYANVRLEKSSVKDHFLLEEICRYRTTQITV